MLINNVLRKSLVIGIILLFVGTSILPSISGNIEKINIVENMPFFSNPPYEEWNKTYGDPIDWEWSEDFDQTEDGGFIILNHPYIWLIKTDNAGNEIWNKTYSGTNARGVEQTCDGGYIIAGKLHASPGNYDALLIKTDINGNEQWRKTFGASGTNRTEVSWDCTQTSDGAYILLGSTNSFGMGNLDAWLIKIDNAGNEIWNKTYGGIKLDRCYEVHQTQPDGGYILFGQTESFGNGKTDAWVIKTDSQGEIEWNRTFGNSNYDMIYSGQQTLDGGYITVGATYITGNQYRDIWLLKLDENGDEQWNRTFNGPEDGGESGNAVQQTEDGGYIIGANTASFGGGNKMWIIKTDSEGDLSWDIIKGDQIEYCYCIQQTVDYGYILIGTKKTFEPENVDIWLIKFSAENDNRPPNKPTIDGPNSGKTGIIYDFDFNDCVDPDGDDMTYYVEWGDGVVDEGFVESGGAFTLSHKWDRKGDYQIKAKLIDDHGAESGWATFDVSIPRTKTLFNHPFQDLFSRFTNLFPILRLILKGLR